ncbi:MAG TPA: hypothetical protein PKE12_03440 [Kiritimatiellia bacterium]|nr:hypothetical protein [Kiritimatiellia bacterium]
MNIQPGHGSSRNSAMPNAWRRPRWSVKTSMGISIGILAVLTPLVLWMVDASIWSRLEMITGIMAAVMAVYFSILLHAGVRIDARERFHLESFRMRAVDAVEGAAYVPFDGPFTEAGAEAGILGAIVGLLLDLLFALFLSFVITFLFWLGVNAVIVLFIPLFWFHRRSLRMLIARGRHCRGRWGPSILHGCRTALMDAFWFYTIFFAAHLWNTLRGGGQV